VRAWCCPSFFRVKREVWSQEREAAGCKKKKKKNVRPLFVIAGRVFSFRRCRKGRGREWSQREGGKRPRPKTIPPSPSQSFYTHPRSLHLFFHSLRLGLRTRHLRTRRAHTHPAHAHTNAARA